MTWIKICGITNLDDALMAVEAGADALGFVFYEKSPRNIDPDSAAEIVAKVPAHVEKVGVFVNQVEDSICAIAAKAGLSAAQLHGDDGDPHVADLVVIRQPQVKILAVISMLGAKPASRAMMWRPEVVHSFLLDSGNCSERGGTGRAFEWQTRRPEVEVIARLGRVVVAGGLTPNNVAEAIRILKPWGVDVSSGVEAHPGKKDPEKVRAFIAAVRNVGNNL